MAIVNAKQFAEATGFPLATIRRWCNEGHIRHWRLGRKLLFDFDKAMKAVEQLQEQPPVYVFPTATPGRKSRSPTAYAGATLPPADGRGAERLRELLKAKRACTVGTVQALGNGS